VASIKPDSVLVVQVFTHHKQYCRWMYPKIYQSLTYKNKYCAFIDEKKYPELTRCSTGEERAATGRQIGIDLARHGNFDWLFFLDLDTEPDPDCIEKMLSLNYPLVGGLHAARGDPWHAIGHNYVSRKTLNRVWLKKSDLENNPVVDAISGGMLLVARGIFSRVDYSGYMGPHTIPLRFTADDEFLEIKIFNSLKIRPKVASNCFSWHYNDDGRAYRLWGEVKQWRPY
jgi:hypothetical protein